MDFSTKLATTRAFTTNNQYGVDAQEVYNEAILQALQGISPTGSSTNSGTAQVVTSTGSVASGAVGVSLITSSDFVGTILGATISANATININPESGATLTSIAYTITSGSITIIRLARP